jgi:type II secretory pathway pseudopilin PulG
VKYRGIALFELLIVIGLIMILMVLAPFTVGSQTRKARDARRKSDLDRVKIALYDYIFDHECFPESLPSCGEKFESGGVVYLESMPCDLNGNPYTYVKQNKDCPVWFRIFTKLEYEQDSSIEEVGCNWGCGPDCEYNYGVTSTNTKADIGCVTYYVCEPGGGKMGSCQAHMDPVKSECPIVFENDPTCGGVDCSTGKNKCKNASGKYVPKELEFY